MKKIVKLIPWRGSAIVLAGLLLAGSAGAGWLDKGMDAIKSLDTSDSSSSGSSLSSTLSVEDISAGLKEALKVGAGNVVEQVGAEDGFNNDDQIHIPLPDSLSTVKSILTRFKMAYLFEDLELKLNRAAEAASPKAKQLFLNAITGMSLDDAKKIYDGPDDAATQYFKGKMSTDLAGEMKPVVEDSLSEVGAVKAYDTMMSKYKDLPMVPDAKANLTDYVIEKGMDGIFYYMAQEEAAIRQNPAKRTTEILQKVFGN